MHDALNPYQDVSTQPGVLQLRLNRTHRLLHVLLSKLLPLFILVMLATTLYFMLQEDNSAMAWWLLAVLPAVVLMLLSPSWPQVTVSKQRIDVLEQKGFRRRQKQYLLQATDNIEVQWKRSYKTAAWSFVLQHADGSSETLFEIPNTPFRQRITEKENLLQALQQWSR
jgi:hypothetical protein